MSRQKPQNLNNKNSRQWNISCFVANSVALKWFLLQIISRCRMCSKCKERGVLPCECREWMCFLSIAQSIAPALPQPTVFITRSLLLQCLTGKARLFNYKQTSRLMYQKTGNRYPDSFKTIMHCTLSASPNPFPQSKASQWQAFHQF